MQTCCVNSVTLIAYGYCAKEKKEGCQYVGDKSADRGVRPDWLQRHANKKKVNPEPESRPVHSLHEFLLKGWKL